MEVWGGADCSVPQASCRPSVWKPAVREPPRTLHPQSPFHTCPCAKSHPGFGARVWGIASGGSVTVCILSIQNSYAGVLNPGPQNVTLFREMVMTSVIQIYESLGQVLIKYDWAPYKKGKFEQRHPGKYHEGEGRAQGDIYKPRGNMLCCQQSPDPKAGSGWDRPSFPAAEQPALPTP